MICRKSARLFSIYFRHRWLLSTQTDMKLFAGNTGFVLFGTKIFCQEAFVAAVLTEDFTSNFPPIDTAEVSDRKRENE